MRHESRLFVALFVAALVALGFADTAHAAKKKLTYDQAYQKCKSLLDKEGTAGTSLQANARYTRGAGCMKKYGYQL